MRLTRLPFPPLCLGCGVGTREAIQHTLDQRHSVRIDLPLCRACQAECGSRRRKAVLIGIALGLVPCALGMLLASPFLDIEDLVIVGLLLIPAGLFLGLIGGLIARDRADPAKFKEDSAAAGTVAMRLRPTASATAFRRALGIDEEADPANLQSPAAVG